MFIATLVLMAASAAGDDQGIVAKGSLVVGSGVVTGILAWLTAKRGWAEKEQKLRAEIENELKTKILNDPLHVEQSGYQAKMKENEKDHENLFLRMNALEKEHSALAAKVDAKFDAITEQLRETKDMVRQLFDRICKGKK
ncbi:MAG: hypothetical protein IKB76_05995 [Kiritimatiellae bacterium]|nr:hypothetical protein [Kiritimatiellia bacterium]